MSVAARSVARGTAAAARLLPARPLRSSRPPLLFFFFGFWSCYEFGAAGFCIAVQIAGLESGFGAPGFVL